MKNHSTSSITVNIGTATDAGGFNCSLCGEYVRWGEAHTCTGQPKKQDNTGWICPKCGKVNAPWKESCDCVIAWQPIPYIQPLPYVPCPQPWQPYPYKPWEPYIGDPICNPNITWTDQTWIIDTTGNGQSWTITNGTVDNAFCWNVCQ